MHSLLKVRSSTAMDLNLNGANARKLSVEYTSVLSRDSNTQSLARRKKHKV